MSDLCDDELFDYENGRAYCYCSCELPKDHEGKHTNGFQIWENKK